MREGGSEGDVNGGVKTTILRFETFSLAVPKTQQVPLVDVADHQLLEDIVERLRPRSL